MEYGDQREVLLMQRMADTRRDFERAFAESRRNEEKSNSSVKNEMDIRCFALELASRLPGEQQHANSIIWSAEQYIKFIKGEL